MSLIPYEILGDLVAELRARRTRAAPASELARMLHECGVPPNVATRYFFHAFEVSLPSFRYYSRAGKLDCDAVGAVADPRIDAARETWMALPPYPDLANRRDREAFRAVARRRGIYLLVCALDPGRDRAAAPPVYVLHGVYAKDTGANLWRPGNGEVIRAELNIALGGERIRSGPQDPWEFRGDSRAGELAGPTVPVHCFEPGGNVDELLDVSSLMRWYESRSITWPFSEEPQPT